jgi:hypothetical protein
MKWKILNVLVARGWVEFHYTPLTVSHRGDRRDVAKRYTADVHNSAYFLRLEYIRI